MTSRSDLSAKVPVDGSVPAKAFVLEVHTDDPDAYLAGIAGRGNVQDTDDAFLSRVFAPSAGEFWVDRLQPRFWVFHTTGPSAPAAAWPRDRVQSRRDTGWMWLPSAHLRYSAPDAQPRRVRTEFDGKRLAGSDDAARDLKVQLSGSHAERLLDKITDLPGYKSAVSFSSIEVDLSDPDPGPLQDADAGGASFAGMPIGIRFSRPIPDLPAFCEELFSSRAPFRLWGQPAVTGDEALVEAVDLHVGQRIGIELGHGWMRACLRAGSCGNTVARLISNLQTRFDGALALTRPSLQEAAGLKPGTALAR
jgi:hypothetical protein